MSKKNNFRKTWRTLTELGQEFSLSAIKFGNLLKQHNLREKDGEPTQLAKDGNFCDKIVPKEGKPYYLWHHEKTVNYLVQLGVEKKGISSKDATLNTEARKLAKAYLEAQKLDGQGDKLGYLMMGELVPDIKKIGIERFNEALKSVGYKGEVVTFEDW
ncbi:hypothetical protein [Crocosphaera sp. XPORK-15E]|uniref:hypothetical protein n=1 Tax=Crocosphaera sp. XPORK-15E TaxID=3110247 RepID=UPI002B203747|nr:hypothetical protein [Crocosphaera sp. XPORK-15E]MEA5535624.1 hypothetical protein [Crocosphaera sp. XPORK-15E]